MTFFAAVYGQESGRVQANWVSRARAERPGAWERPRRSCAEAGTRLDMGESRFKIAAALPAYAEDHERQEEDGERWDGLS